MIIVACGARKHHEPAPARDLYRGAYFRACLAYALRIAPAKDVYILSAKYGLIGLNNRIEPYDLKLGEAGSIGSGQLSVQAENLCLLREKVTVLGGKLYVNLVRNVWKHVEAPLDGKGGLGPQMAWMRSQPNGMRK